MENGGEGTTMTPGTVVPIGHGPVATTFSSNERVKQSQSDRKPISIVEYRESKQRKAEQTQPPSSKKDTNHKIADNIFEFAKKKGTDKAFEKLANGKFEEHEIPSETRHSELVSESQSEKEKSYRPVDGTNETDLSPIEQQVITLEAKVARLVEENKNLEKKVAEAQALAHAGLSTALELAKVLKELIEQEEEEKKKKHEGLLAILAKLIAQMLILVTVPEDQQKEIIDELNKKQETAKAA